MMSLDDGEVRVAMKKDDGGREPLLLKEVFVPVRRKRDLRCVFVMLVAVVAVLIYLSGLKKDFTVKRNIPGVSTLSLVPFTNLTNANDVNVYVFKASNNPKQTVFAVTAVVGLLNRASPVGQPMAFSMIRQVDNFWVNQTVIQDLEAIAANQGGVVNLMETSWEQMIQLAFDQGVLGSKILYRFSEEYSLPAIATAVGVYDGLPIPDDFQPMTDFLSNNPAINALPTALDSRGKWAAEDQVGQVRFTMDTTMSMTDTLNLAVQRPNLLAEGYLVDYIASKKLTTIWMDNLCIPWSQDNQAFHEITQNNPHWSKEEPLSIMGYYGASGGLFESVGVCTERRTEFAYVSDFSTGLSFHDKIPSITETTNNITHPSTTPLVYDPTKTYLMLMTSDGDNLQIVQDLLMRTFTEKIRRCDVALEKGLDMEKECPRQSWTFNARTTDIAPNYIRYFYELARKHGRDAFLQGPTGYGYQYPALIKEDSDAERCAELTAQKAKVAGMSAYAHWDWAMTFPWAKNHMRRYAGTAIEAIFVAVVPLVLPQFTFASEDVIRDEKGDVLIFTEDLRWTAPGDNFNGISLTPQQVAERYNKKPLGTLNFAYKIYDVSTEEVVQMAKNLSDHVIMVDYKQLINLRKQKTALEGHPVNHRPTILAITLICIMYLVYVIKKYY